MHWTVRLASLVGSKQTLHFFPVLYPPLSSFPFTHPLPCLTLPRFPTGALSFPASISQ